MCSIQSGSNGHFELILDEAKVLKSGICRCQVASLKKTVGFWIALNNFSCPEDACPWRFQVIADGCVKDQYCCSNHWEGQEIAYFPYTEHVSTVYLQISQLANPPVSIGTVSVSVMIEEENQLSESGAQLTCGIAADKSHKYNFVSCGRMPDLKHEPESYVPLKKRAAGDVVDLCTARQVTENPVTFGMNVAPDYGDKICNARISSIPGTNTYKYTVAKFTCSESCAFRLMIIVGKCIKHYFCCGANFQEVTKLVETVEGDSYVRVFKFGSQPAQLDFSLTILVADMQGQMSPIVLTSGVPDVMIGDCKAACLEVTRKIKICPPAITDKLDSGTASNATNATIPSIDRIQTLIIVLVSGYATGAGMSIPLFLYIRNQCGFMQNGLVVNSLAAHLLPYITANGGTILSFVFHRMQLTANNGFSAFDITALLLIGGEHVAGATMVIAVPLVFLLG